MRTALTFYFGAGALILGYWIAKHVLLEMRIARLRRTFMAQQHSEALLDNRLWAWRRANHRMMRDLWVRDVPVEDCPMGVFVQLTDPELVAEYVAHSPAFGARGWAA